MNETLTIEKTNKKRGGYREGSGSSPIDFEPRIHTVRLTQTEFEELQEKRKERGLLK